MITDADEREGARDIYAVLDGTLSRGCVISHFPMFDIIGANLRMQSSRL